MSEAESKPPLQGFALAVAALAINIALFAEVLDLSIINVAIPAIAGGLSASPTEGTWAISSYALSSAAAQPLTGWLTQRFGEIRLFIASTLLFTIASLFCGIAPNIELLVVFRLIQGAVAGPLMPLSQALMMNTFPPHQRGLAQGIWGMTALAAPTFGPIIGGWVTDNYSWRWDFFINLPVGVFSAAVMLALMRGRDRPTIRVPVDFVGALLLFLGVGAMQFMFDNGHQKDWFGSSLIIGLAVVAAISIALFIAWERYERHPIVDFSLFRERNFTICVFLIALGYGASFGTIVIFALWLQTTLGYTATLAGLASAGLGAVAIVFAAGMGIFSNRIPKRTVVVLSFLVYAATSIWLALLPGNATFWQLAAPRLVQGIAVPVNFIALSDIMLAGIPPERLASATALASAVRTLFLSLGTALSVTLWDQRSDIHHILLAEGVNPERLAGIGGVTEQMMGQNSGAGNLTQGLTQGLALLDNFAQVQSRTLAFNDYCWVVALVFMILLPFVFLTKRVEGTGSGGMMH